jgi:hypothetical protein
MLLVAVYKEGMLATCLCRHVSHTFLTAYITEVLTIFIAIFVCGKQAVQAQWLD